MQIPACVQDICSEIEKEAKAAGEQAATPATAPMPEERDACASIPEHILNSAMEDRLG